MTKDTKDSNPFLEKLLYWKSMYPPLSGLTRHTLALEK